MTFCTRCGRQVAGPVNFCPGCGTPLPPAPPAARPAPRPPGRPGRWVIGVTVLVVAALAGGAITWQLTRPAARLADAANGQPATSTATPVTSPPVSTTPPASSTSPAGITVTIGPGARSQPGAAQVATFMAGYFDAINRRDYQSYLAKFDEQARPDYTRPKFLAEFSTTTDTAPGLTALRPAAGGLLATVTFTSHQSPAKSYTHTACTAWTLRVYLEAGGTSYLIGLPPPGSPQTTARAR